MNSKPKNKKNIYFDNNGTTLISPQSKKAVTKYLSCYNASSDSTSKQSMSQSRLPGYPVYLALGCNDHDHLSPRVLFYCLAHVWKVCISG